LTAVLFAAGVAWATGAGVFAYAGAVVVLALLPVAGYLANRWLATLQLAGLLVLAALTADVILFGPDVTPDDEYERLTIFPFAILVSPLFMLLVAAGVAARRVRERSPAA
jgi:hypothetical protein